MENNIVVITQNQLCDVVLKGESRKHGTLIVGGVDSKNASDFMASIIKQDIDSKKIGLTLFDIKGIISDVALVYSKSNRKKCQYFNPLHSLVKFNPLAGSENQAIQVMLKSFERINQDAPQFFKDVSANLIINAVKIIKRLYGEKATLREFAEFIQNIKGHGKRDVIAFSRLECKNHYTAQENAEIGSWFLNTYFNEKEKTFEHASHVRAVFQQFVTDPYIVKALFLSVEEKGEVLDFEKSLKHNGVVIIDLSSSSIIGENLILLRHMLTAQYQEVIFQQPRERILNNLYLDSLDFFYEGLEELMLPGGDYNISIHAATSNLVYFNARKKLSGGYLSLLDYFGNIIALSGLRHRNSACLSDLLFLKDIMEELLYLGEEELYYYLLDKSSKGRINKGRGKTKLLTPEELSFIKKRMKVYRRQFS